MLKLIEYLINLITFKSFRKNSAESFQKGYEASHIKDLSIQQLNGEQGDKLLDRLLDSFI